MSRPAILVGTIPAPHLESATWRQPGLMTAVMKGYYTGESPNTSDPGCPIGGVVLVGFETFDPMDGEFGVIRWTYMGGVDNAGGGGGGDGGYNEENSVMDLEIWADQTPIGMHPNFAKLFKEHGGTLNNGQISFPMADPTGNSKRAGVNEAGETIMVNPLYGVSSYYSPRAKARFKKFQPGNPDTTTLGLIDSPPYNFGGKANSWLKSGVFSKNFGNSKEVVEEWLFAYDGWDTKIYTYD
jgi:hypothetical protein